MNAAAEQKLTLEEQAIFDTLVDPDENLRSDGPTFDWGQDFQRGILGTLLIDRQFLADHADLIKAGHFSLRAHREIAKVLLGHWNKYKTIPSQMAVKEELRTIGKAEDRLGTLAELFSSIEAYEPGMDSREYLAEKILSFARRCRIQEAIQSSIKAMQSPKDGVVDWDKIHTLLKGAVVEPVGKDVGLDYFGTLDERYGRMAAEQEGSELFTTSLPSLDSAMTNGGMRRGELHGVMSPPGVGKSLLLVRMSVANLHRGKRVLYISLEMSADDIAQRFDAQLAGHDIRTLLADRETVIPQVASTVEGHEDRQRLVIKQFPGGTANVDTIRAYIERLQQTTGFRPDVVAVDYVGEMKDFSGVPTYESRERLVKELRGLAVEQDMLFLTAFQPNREAKSAMEAGVIDDSMLADAYGQLRPLDGLWTLNQSQADKDQNIGRLYVAKLRNGESRKTYYIEYDAKTLAIREIAHNRYQARLSDYKKPATSDDQVASLIASRKSKNQGNAPSNFF